MGAAVIPLMAAGGLMGAFGSLQEGAAAEQAAEFNAQTDMQNAKLARRKAAEDERVFRIGAAKEMGSARVAIGASGIQREGSALDVLSENAATAELDALKIRHAGEVDAFGYERSAASQRAQGKAAKRQGYFKAAGAIIGAGASIAGRGK